MSESDRLRRWIRSIPESSSDDEFEEPDDGPAIFVQLDALHDERVERKDPHWSPPGPDPQALERLVEERRARGVLRLPPKRRR